MQDWDYLRLDDATVEDLEEATKEASDRLSAKGADSEKESYSKKKETNSKKIEQGRLLVLTASSPVKVAANPDSIILCDFGFNSEVDNQRIRWSESSEAEERVVQIFQMVCPNTMEEGILAAQEASLAFPTLFDKRPNGASMSTPDLLNALSFGSEKIFGVRISCPPIIFPGTYGVGHSNDGRGSGFGNLFSFGYCSNIFGIFKSRVTGSLGCQLLYARCTWITLFLFYSLPCLKG